LNFFASVRGGNLVNSWHVNVESSIWDKLTRVVIVLLVIAGLAGIGVWYLPLIRQNERYRREVLRLDALVQKEADAQKQLTASIEALRNDPKTVERLAREKLGYAKSGETVIRFENRNTNEFLIR
jgi:cell division protein FtsB